MTTTVTFEVPVELEEDFVDEETAVDEAKEMLFSAPAFDGISGHAIDHVLEVGSVELE